jgi:beta-1,2-mannobiose phosphorylase / 1,2-beta-oligomannan phosphorylase
MNPVVLTSLRSRVTRLGIVLEPNGDASEAEGILNPAAVRARNGTLLLYPRMVASGNCSCIGLVEVNGSADAPVYQRLGMVLRPAAPYEFRDLNDGHGCEDPRVTFIPVLDAFVMAYTAYGASGPRIALALSPDGYAWKRLGLMDFSASGLLDGSDKDGAFFPEPVRSPMGVLSLALYHRPMAVRTTRDADGTASGVRDVMRIAYVPLEAVLAQRTNLLNVAESVIVSEPVGEWGLIKNGAGTPPVRIGEGWLSVFHGVDRIVDADGAKRGVRYSAGILVHDAEEPHRIRYRSARPILTPDSIEEQHGIVNNVVFPTGIDVQTTTPRTYDVYYGMADARVGRLHLELDGSSLEATL